MGNNNIHDCGYKNFFQNPVAVKQLLTSFVNEAWIHQLDFDTLERMNTSFVTDEFKEKESDMIYRVQINGKDTYIYLLIEFQSTVDRFMPLRMLRYITEFYEYLVKSQKMKQLPSVFPLLLYNGDRKLLQIQNVVSALFYVENSVPEELAKEIDNLYDMVKNEKPDEIAVLTNWLRVIFRDDTRGIYHEVKQAEEIRTMFATKLEQYGEKLRKEALREGKLQGKQEGKLEGKLEGIHE